MKKFDILFESIMEKLEQEQIPQENVASCIQPFGVNELIEALKAKPELVTKFYPRYNEYRIKFAPHEFRKQYDRNATNPGWALYNICKNIWSDSKNTVSRWEDVPIHVYGEYISIDK